MSEFLADLKGDPVFVLCALVGLAGALTVVLRRNPVYGALGLMAAFLSVAVVFLKLSAPFLAAMHVLVYTGAILVLFLFVIMLLNLGSQEMGKEHPRRLKAAMGIQCAGLLALLTLAATRGPDPGKPFDEIRVKDVAVLGKTSIVASEWGGVEHVGTALFTKWVFPFELISLLILVAVIGAVVLSKKKLPPEV